MRNSSLVECSRAEDVTGLNILPKLWDLINLDIYIQEIRSVGERCMDSEAATKVSCGDHTSENVGMSSEGRVRISSAECPRVPGEGSSAQG